MDSLHGVNRCLVPFVACGDLSGFDSDRSYPLTAPVFPSGKLDGSQNEKQVLIIILIIVIFYSYVFKDPVQAPTEPAYKKAVLLKKSDKLVKANSHGNTVSFCS